MPVHLFGRPAPLAELAALGHPDRRGRRAGLRRRGRRDDRRRLDLQLLPDQEPVRARRRRPRRRHRRGARRAHPAAPLPRLARQEGLRAGRLQLAPRRAPGRGAAPLPAASSTAGTPRAARPPPATRSSASASSASCPPTSPATSTTCTSSARPSATASARRSRRPGSRNASYYVDAAPPPAGAALPRLGGRARCPRPSGPRARTSRCRCGPGSPPRRRSASSTRDPRGVAGGARVIAPINRHRIWQLVADAGLVALALVPRLPAALRPGRPALLRDALQADDPGSSSRSSSRSSSLFGFYNRWWRYVSTRDMWGAARGVTRRVPRRRASSSTSSRPVAQVRLPRSVAIMDWLLLLAFVAGARLLARTLIERPRRGGLVARGKEVIVVGAGDAGQLMSGRCCATRRSATRRSA